MITPYHYLLGTHHPAASMLVDELRHWHNRMVAHVRQHGAAPRGCRCAEAGECPRVEAVDLWSRAEQTFGAAAAQLTFLRRHACGDAHG